MVRVTRSKKKRASLQTLPPFNTTGTEPVDKIPIEILAYILTFLSIQDKFTVKTVSKKWNVASFMALREQDAICIEDSNEYLESCSSESHMTGSSRGNNIPLMAVEFAEERKRFFSQMLNLKVFHLRTKHPRLRIVKYYLTSPLASKLECLQLTSLPFTVCLPNLRHFHALSLQRSSLESILNGSPRLTTLRVDLRVGSRITTDYFDLLLKLPKGLEVVEITSKTCDLLAIISSPAMATLKALKFKSACTHLTFVTPVSSYDYRVIIKNPLNLKYLNLNLDWEAQPDYGIISKILLFIKSCKLLTEITVRTNIFCLEDYVSIFSSLSGLNSIELEGLSIEPCDDLFKVIAEKNKTSLCDLMLKWVVITDDSPNILANLTSLQRLILDVFNVDQNVSHKCVV